jgi:hypothetical protein
VAGALTYTPVNPASEPTPGKHRVPKNTQVEWCCDAGPIAIHFYKGNTTKLFASGNNIIQSAVAGTPTPVEVTKNNATKQQYKYSVSVATGNGLIFDDPRRRGRGPKAQKEARPVSQDTRQEEEITYLFLPEY